MAAKDRALICIDSDGTVFDAMTWKHEQCFGPQFVRFWNLQSVGPQALAEWNRVNLYAQTRGVNRFKALALVLESLREQGLCDADIAPLQAWLTTSKALGNDVLLEAIQAGGDAILQRAYDWSRAVNECIRAHGESKPFAKALEVIPALAAVADVAVVSSANREAIVAEWQEAGLMPCVHAVYTQEQRSKADCLALLLAEGYAKDRALMMGDALADLSAAQAQGVWFYPVLAGDEENSWTALMDTCVQPMLAGAFTQADQDRLTGLLMQRLST